MDPSLPFRKFKGPPICISWEWGGGWSSSQESGHAPLIPLPETQPFHMLSFLATPCQLLLYPNSPTNKYLSKYKHKTTRFTSFLDSFLWARGHREQKILIYIYIYFFTLEIIQTTQKVQKSWLSSPALLKTPRARQPSFCLNSGTFLNHKVWRVGWGSMFKFTLGIKHSSLHLQIQNPTAEIFRSLMTRQGFMFSIAPAI